ncbi:alpha/beta-hydrolase [Auricularia subglabra TFB-10046 SS5]|uniref:Alpha/beta-hydrolase n=1 Tax=Auricularia subglabra (strain TFB-10046 / SS5) TaxID=717982 RepID=J0WZ26_AURST|nr:alpha/beta-hydrolase [Auricularia subglabra TFB-10046 SS5]
MISSFILVAAILAGSAHAFPLVSRQTTCTNDTTPTPQPSAGSDFDWFSIKSGDVLLWTDCFDTFKCARLNVPLDYTEPEGAKAQIALQMQPATDRTNYKGILLLNPGGPGGSGTQTLGQLGASLRQVVGPGYDLIGFDPRGVGATVPNAQCFGPEEFDAFMLREVLVTRPGDNSVALARRRDEVIAAKCVAALGDAARFMDTGSVATDMVSIATAMGQEKVNYWGISYGTVLGQYFAAMFPEKIGLMFIDGVADAVHWRDGEVTSAIQDADKVMDEFYDRCSKAGPSVCAIAESTPEATKDRVFKILDSLKEGVAVPEHGTGPVVITLDMFLSFARLQLYHPIESFPKLSAAFAALDSNDQTFLNTFLPDPQQTASTPAWLQLNEALHAVACSDFPDLSNETLAESTALVQGATNTSFWAGPIMARVRLQCVPWDAKIRPKNRFAGPLQLDAIPGGSKILVGSNTIDPVCPLEDARAVAGRYASAALLVQETSGHTITLQMGSCAAQAIGAFFQAGVLPAEGTTCQPDIVPFSA